MDLHAYFGNASTSAEKTDSSEDESQYDIESLDLEPSAPKKPCTTRNLALFQAPESFLRNGKRSLVG